MNCDLCGKPMIKDLVCSYCPRCRFIFTKPQDFKRIPIKNGNS